MTGNPCKKCHLYKTRTNIVLGRGKIPASVLIIGEAPGVSEDLTGKAFVGQSGKLLDKLLGDFKDYYIINTVLCRPCDSKDGPNRKPSNEEILKCSENVYRIIKRVSPKVVILAGKVAEEVFGKEFPDAFKIQHPAFLLRTGGLFSPYIIQNTLKIEEAIHAAGL
jgi:uracil-DNA glycosylase family 4